MQNKPYAYREGRKAGSAHYPRTDNPYSHAVGEWGYWDIGWLDGHTDIGWSKPEKKSKKPSNTEVS